MSRPLRIQFPGAFYHITARGNERAKIFLDDRDKKKFLKYLIRIHQRYGVRIHSYVLMSNHYHLILETPEVNLSRAMHNLNTAYTVYFNTRHKRVGHLFQGRFKSILVERGQYLSHLSRYIHLNPVRSGQVKSPEAYKWSSYRSYIGFEPRFPWLEYEIVLSEIGSKGRGKSNYKKFMDRLIKKGIMENPFENLKAQCILGSETFFENVRQLAPTVHREIPGTKRIRTRVNFIFIIETVAAFLQVSVQDIIRKRKKENLPRTLAIYLIRKHTSLNLQTIGKHFGNIGYTAVSQVISKLEKRLSSDDQLRGTLNRIENLIIDK